MLQQWLMPQLQQDSENLILQQDGACHTSILTSVLTSVLTFLVIGLSALLTMTLLFFPDHQGYIKDRVYVNSTSCDLPRERQRIVEAFADIDRGMLQRVWQELDYRTDFCRVTKGGYIEHL
jgi:hypothetical protein